MSTAWITCPHCGEKRNLSGNFISPANRAKDQRSWILGHGSGACLEQVSRLPQLDDGFDEPHHIPHPAFDAAVDITGLIPALSDIPHGFGGHDMSKPCNAFAADWIAAGNPLDVWLLSAHESIDGPKAIRHIAVIERSSQPTADHKAAAMAWLASRWFAKVYRK